jgi:hypothetical protein
MRSLLVAFVLAFSAGVGCRNRCDTSSDENVRAIYHRATGRDLPSEKEWRCIDRVSDFPGVVKIGNFAYDRGCAYEGIIYGCSFGSTSSLQAKVLAASGWAKADPKKRGDLARNWLQSVEGERMLDEATPAFAAEQKTFTPPELVSQPDGGLIWRYWSSQSHGMTIGAHYYHVESAFKADGSPGEGKSLEDFDSRS